MKKEVISREECQLNPDRICKLTQSGHITEIMEMSVLNRKQTVQKIDKDHAVILSSGEVIELKHSENRAENSKGIRKSMKDLRDLINANVSEVANCRWVTLTYAENMTDPERLYRDIEVYHKRWKRWHIKQGYSIPEYILTVEPQARGAWHCHVVYIYPSIAPFIPNATLAELWQQGFVTVKKLDDVDNVGAYLTAYLCDIPVEEAEESGRKYNGFEVKECEFADEKGVMQKKKFIKGARIYMYPAGMNFYRSSRGVKRPTVEWTTVTKAQKKVSADTLTYEKFVRLSDEETGFSSDLSYRYFNAKRKNSQ